MLPRIAGLLLCLLIGALGSPAQAPRVEVIRDRWGVPHIFAANENDGFWAAGYVSAEDRLLQMDLFRRRATGRLAEILGPQWVASDRKFRIAGIHRHCLEAAAGLPEEMRAWLAAYAAGVNEFIQSQPDKVRRRFDKLAALPQPWTEADSVCAWWAGAEVFDPLFDDGAVTFYQEFQQSVAQLGEEQALQQRGMIIDDAAAVVPESEMAKDAAVYAKLKAAPKTPGWSLTGIPDDRLKFSHAWAVDGTRTATGKPLLESDPQTSVNNPPLWYEFHLSAGRFDVRGIGFPGVPAFLIGFNRKLAWGATALGAGSEVTFLEKLGDSGTTYLHQGRTESFKRRLETIAVKGAAAVEQAVLTSRHGFVFDSLANQAAPRGYARVSHLPQVESRATSIRALLAMMSAGNWQEFREAMQHYFSPGLHIVYADAAGNLGYQTLVHVPLTRRTRRMALEGWTGADEVLGRIPLDEMPHLLNPDSHFVSHANNLPVGSWYPHDLGIATGGTGHSTRSLRLIELLAGSQVFSAETFESRVHRDDVNAAVAKLFPIARRLAEQTGITESGVPALLDALKNWDLRYRSAEPGYAAAQALAGSLLTPYRRAPLNAKLGGGEGGFTHLARLLADQYSKTDAIPADPDVRAYLASWLRLASDSYQKSTFSRATHSMPYQANGPLGLPSLDPRLDVTSPALSCTQVSTIWSQQGNSYTQIVDLGDIDASRTVLPPGLSEDPDSPWHTNQVELWVKGTTHPAPLSRDPVEAVAGSRSAFEPAGLPSSGRIAVVNAASFAREPVLSPGSLAAIFGVGIAPGELAETKVLVNGAPAPLLYVSPAQINFQLPNGVRDAALIEVLTGSKRTAVAAVWIAPAAPGVFTIANDDGSANSPENPAAPGSLIRVYATGLGEPANSGEPPHRTAVQPEVLIGGLPAEVQFSGAAPEQAGVYRIDVRLPEGLAAGGSAPLVVSASYLESNAATVAVGVR